MALPDAFDEPADTHEEIVAATYRALCEHGYANLTIQRIADEFPKSKSLLYHHYDSKDALLLEFLSFMLERFASSAPESDYEDAGAQLEGLLAHVLLDECDEERREFTRAMIELQTQAAHDPAYREAFTRSHRFFHDRLVDVLERGIEEGVFHPVDPDAVATTLLTTFAGARFTRSTADAEAVIPRLRGELEAYLSARVYVDGSGSDASAADR